MEIKRDKFVLAEVGLAVPLDSWIDPRKLLDSLLAQVPFLVNAHVHRHRAAHLETVVEEASQFIIRIQRWFHRRGSEFRIQKVIKVCREPIGNSIPMSPEAVNRQ